MSNQPDLCMDQQADWYKNNLQFHRFWSVDDTQMHTSYSAMRNVVMANWNERIKLPINEPAPGLKKSQVQEFIDFNGSAGIQHIALATDDIIQTVINMLFGWKTFCLCFALMVFFVKKGRKSRGCEFLDTIPDCYYDALFKKLESAPITVTEDLEMIKKLDVRPLNVFIFISQ